ncbi:MAG: restriction endonuclease [Bacteroidales bacterium]|nr:restriction endonuclease [Bacteroidales bacterium]
MAIPKFEDFLYPFLYQLKDKDVSTKDMKSALIKHFDLSDEDCMLRTRSGSTLQLSDRIGWCRQWLRRALFIEIPQRGIYRITKRGQDYLKKNTDLREADLLQYPEFKEYSTGSKAENVDNSNNTNEETLGLTPTEQMENAYKSINKDLTAELLQRILEQTPQFFEHLVVDLIVKMGYGGSFANSARVTQYAHDDGIDGIIYEDKLGLDKIYIQAKRYKLDNVVGKPQIQQFSGALDEPKATKGVFITTSSYSKEARQYVEKLNSKKIVLIDGQDLAQFMIEYNVGVSTKQVYEIKRIDSDYFEE